MMTPHEKAELIRLIKKIPTTTECADCMHYDGKFCKAAGAEIPDEVRKTGCELWEFDETSPPF